MVGENGSGKTTLGSLLAFVHTPTEGTMRVNGATVSGVDRTRLRTRVAVVHQEFLQMLMSVTENITLRSAGGEDVESRVADAARFAEIAAVIEQLPAGYQTLLGTEYSGGLELSRGQWQRLATARAWFKDADVLILDEPSSALDPAAEVELIERIRTLAKDKLVVLISHRFGTVSKADRIIVLDRGRLIESGTHSILMASGGRYSQMYAIQASEFSRPVSD
jgi:ABC-type multidrug transport system fused ATPase/permease subunit